MTDRALVAGAGPVGLVAANALADHGVPVLVLEAEPALPETLRGSTFHPPTLNTHTILNKQKLEARDAETQQRFRETLRWTAADPEAEHEYLFQVSMIASLRRAASLA